MARDSEPDEDAQRGPEEEQVAEPSSGYGLSPDNPIMTGMGPSGARRYFKHLRCPDGDRLSFERHGSTPVLDTSYIDEGEGWECPIAKEMYEFPTGSVPIDIYEVVCESGTHKLEPVFVDMYHMAPDRCTGAEGWRFVGASPDGRTLEADEATETHGIHGSPVHPPEGSPPVDPTSRDSRPSEEPSASGFLSSMKEMTAGKGEEE